MKHNKKTVTYNELKSMGACSEGLDWVEEESHYKRKRSPNHRLHWIEPDSYGVEWRDCPILVSQLYQLVCKEKHQWIDWMDEHFTCEALGIIVKAEQEYFVTRVGESLTLKPFAKGMITVCSEFGACNFLPIIDYGDKKCGILKHNFTVLDFDTALSPLEQAQMLWLLIANLPAGTTKERALKMLGSKRQYKNECPLCSAYLSQGNCPILENCNERCALLYGEWCQNPTQANAKVFSDYLLTLEDPEKKTKQPEPKQPEKQEFCECYEMKTQKEKGVFFWCPCNKGKGAWICSALKTENGGSGSDIVRHCYSCGKQLAPPKPPERTFKVGDKIEFDDEFATIIDCVFDGTSKIALVYPCGTVVACKWIKVSSHSAITESELRKIVGDTTIEKAE